MSGVGQNRRTSRVRCQGIPDGPAVLTLHKRRYLLKVYDAAFCNRRAAKSGQYSNLVQLHLTLICERASFRVEMAARLASRKRGK